MNKNMLSAVILAVGAIGFGACSSTSTNTVSTGNTGISNVIGNSTVTVNRPVINAPVETVNIQPANTAVNAKTPVKIDETATADISKNEKIGVAECDEYLEKYAACINAKVPEAERAALLPQMKIYQEGWQKAAANQQAKALLPGGCKVALETAKQSLAKYSCDW